MSERELLQQQREVQPLLQSGSALLWWEMRLGKTGACLQAFEELRQDARRGPWSMVVICPEIAKEVWRKEALEMGFQVQTLTLYGAKRKRVVDHGGGDGFGTMLIVNWEIAPRWLPELREASEKAILVLDEPHDHICNPANDRHKLAYSLSLVADRVWETTGTAYRKVALDLYWQLRMLGPKANPFQTWSPLRFAHRFSEAVPNPWAGRLTGEKYRTGRPKRAGGFDFKGIKDELELLSRLPCLDKRTADDVPYVPLRNPTWVDEGPGYEHRSDQLLEHSLQKLIPLKVKRTAEYVQALPFRPVVVFGWHREYCEQVSQALDAPLIYGGSQDRTQVIEWFQQGRLPVLVCNLKAAGVAIDLARASQAVVGEVWWDEVVHRQAEARILGPRQTAKHPTVHYLLVTNSADEYVWEVRLHKGEAINRLDSAGRQLREVGA